LGVIAPTGKSFSNPAEDGMALVDGDRVAAIQIDSPPGGGLVGILTQLGIDMG
jgi:hypothetical protein